MNQLNYRMQSLKEEGLRIVDEDGFEFETEDQNQEAHMLADFIAKHEDSIAQQETLTREEWAMVRENLTRIWYNNQMPEYLEREERLWRTETENSGRRLDSNEDESWVDPAGGLHYSDDDDPAQLYV